MWWLSAAAACVTLAVAAFLAVPLWPDTAPEGGQPSTTVPTAPTAPIGTETVTLPDGEPSSSTAPTETAGVTAPSATAPTAPGSTADEPKTTTEATLSGSTAATVAVPTGTKTARPSASTAAKPVTTTTTANGSTKTTTKTTAKPTAKPTSKSTAKPTTVNGKKQRYLALMDSENAWVASCQLANGAIAMTPTRSGIAEVNPYFADIAALSLLNQPDKYANKVKRYMDWHFAHLNTAQTDPSGVDGTIFDWQYTVSSGTVVLEEWLTAKPSYDSTDSYAATFLMVVNKYVQQTGDTDYAVKNAAKLGRVVNALFATMDNGLTMATPKSHVKLLMDNCEVYGGLQAAVELYRDVLIPAGAASADEAERLEQAARDVSNHVENELWTGTFYRPSITQTGEPYHDFSWKDYYPCAIAQTFPILYGLLDPASERAGKLYEQYCWRFDWENLNHPDDYIWGSNAYTAALMGDTERVDTYLAAYEKLVAASHGDPLYNADVAWVAMTAYYMSQQ